VCIGLYNIYFGELVWGLLYIGLGRLADIADGYVAHATGTKSQIGEAVDATIDKLTILMSLVVFLATGILPLVAVAIIGLRNSINISLSVAARLQKQILHPSLAGKFAAATEWATVLLFILAAIANEQTWESLEMIMLTAAWAMLGVSLFIGVTAIKDYAQDVFKKI
jgi:phosphatidylglycerophosphate synthase